MTEDKLRRIAVNASKNKVQTVHPKRSEPVSSKETVEGWLKPYSIGEKLKTLRLRKKLGLVELGRHTGLSAALLSKLERSKLYPTLPTLARIATVFDVGLDHFFTDERKRHVVALAKKQDRQRFPERPGTPEVAYFFETLDYGATPRKLNAYYADFQKIAKEKLKPHTHAGAEHLYLLSGALVIAIGGHGYELEAGDAIYFDSSVPHAYCKSGDNLRSDSVTLPTEEMLEAMRVAELGDDVYGEDPTVNRLEELAAKKMGKEAALFTTSGTQANLVSVMSQTKRGDEVVLEADAHLYYEEAGAFCVLGGLVPRLVTGRMGVMTPQDIEAVLRSPDIHFPPTSLICIENPHNRSGGTVWSPRQIKELCGFAKRRGLNVHMDGARIFNAAIAQNIDVRELTRHVDTLMFCLYKGLSAPIGSLVVGSRELVDRARRYRKMLGGGMRQAGTIAAAGIIAIEKTIDRLKDDHENAKLLARGLSNIDGLSLDPDRVQTNIVLYDVSGLRVTASEWTARMHDFGVKAHSREDGRVRMVTHRDIEKEDIEYTLGVAEKVARQIRDRYLHLLWNTKPITG